MKGCTRCWQQEELDLLDGDPELLSDKIVHKFAWESTDHFDRDEYELAWRRLGYRVVRVLEQDPDDKLTAGLKWARFDSWPEDEQTALRTLVTDVVVRAAGDPERRWKLDELLQAAAQLDQDIAPWLRLADTFEDDAVAVLADTYADLYVYSAGPMSWMMWDDSNQPIHDWLLSPALRARLSTIDSPDAQDAVKNIDLMIEFSIR
ncbi:hypothetical protein [Lentzea sp. NBRC 102530]|uniref:hypothetical protein n=1 Tax=Lentzea sp. NBRC 102530 TaxID=3032201 RepID=UPI00249FDE58|nr:hypothetical protein [Lentzea sp. NBRC 102530]GLY52728.1 hypothetical protein Lesp01_63840 [Lentzea sp. NBRC 102530]